MELCDVIKIRRSELGLTLAQIAEACGVGSSIVAKWERGEVTNLRRDSINSLADVLQVSPLTLLGREELPAKQTASTIIKEVTSMGNYLADRRMELGLTQKEISEMVGVSEATVSRWESGAIANMRRDKIKLYAEVLKVSPTFIISGKADSKVVSAPTLSKTETYLLDKFRSLDSRGQSAVLNTLEHEYQAMHGDGSADPVPNNA